jgi:hypothetical protein
MYRMHSNACVQECVCDEGHYVRTNAGEFKRMPMYAVERTRYVRTQSAKYIYIFFKQLTHKNIHKHKAKYLQNTSTPPPNLICHIAHNVTKCTILRVRVNLGIA